MKTQSRLVIDGLSITLNNFYQAVYNSETRFEIADQARQAMKKSRDYIDSRIATGEVMYGVNTGFGAFSSVRISDSEHGRACRRR